MILCDTAPGFECVENTVVGADVLACRPELVTVLVVVVILDDGVE